MSNLNPAQFHPNIIQYGDRGQPGVPPEHSVVGYVRTSLLRTMHGNDTIPERVEHYRQLLRSGQGYTEPAIVDYDPKRSWAVVDDGNHRVTAAHLEGHEYTPVRVWRTTFDQIEPGVRARLGGQMGHLPPATAEHYPANMHPSHVFPEEHVWKGRR
jgi:hypothetical protein